MSTVKEQHKTLLEALGSVVAPLEAAYFSTPVTTGKRYLDFLKHYTSSGLYNEIELKKLKHEKVFLPNVEESKHFVEHLRLIYPVVIDPSAMPNYPWTQDEWLDYWEQVIKIYARTVIFAEGWQYSSGCSKEFAIAIKNNKECLTHDRQPLLLADGIGLLNNAVQDYNNLSVPDAANKIKAALNILKGE